MWQWAPHVSLQAPHFSHPLSPSSISAASLCTGAAGAAQLPQPSHPSSGGLAAMASCAVEARARCLGRPPTPRRRPSSSRSAALPGEGTGAAPSPFPSTPLRPSSISHSRRCARDGGTPSSPRPRAPSLWWGRGRGTVEAWPWRCSERRRRADLGGAEAATARGQADLGGREAGAAPPSSRAGPPSLFLLVRGSMAWWQPWLF